MVSVLLITTMLLVVGSAFRPTAFNTDNLIGGIGDKKRKATDDIDYAIFSSSITKRDCPKDFQDISETLGETCFLFFLSKPKTFADAENFCVRHGGNLAMPKTDLINQFLLHNLYYTYKIKDETGSTWIGLRYDESKLDYRWVDGSALNFTDFYRDERYQQCYTLSPITGKWHEANCSPIKKYFVCEIQVKKENSASSSSRTTAHPATTTTIISSKTTTYDKNTKIPITKDQCKKIDDDENEKSIQILGQKCYYFNVKSKLPFGKAEDFCELHGGTLAMVKSKEINDFLQRHLDVTHDLSTKSDADPVWIGSRYNETQKGYQWVDGTALTYTNFLFEDQNNYCVCMSPLDGRWQEAHCESDVKYFVCELPAMKPTPSPTPTVVVNPKKTTPQSGILSTATKVLCPKLPAEYIKEYLQNGWKCYVSMVGFRHKFQCAPSNSPTGIDPKNIVCEYGSDTTTPIYSTVTVTHVTTPSGQDLSSKSSSYTTLSFSTSKPPTSTPTSTNEATSKTTQTTPTMMTTTCAILTCELDCGMDGYFQDPKTGCLMCQCDV